MKLVKKNTVVFAYDEDMNEIRIQLFEDIHGREKLFIGSAKEWKLLDKSLEFEDDDNESVMRAKNMKFAYAVAL